MNMHAYPEPEIGHSYGGRPCDLCGGGCAVKKASHVTYLQTCRGGYGFTREVPAVFVRAGAKRHTIRVRASDGSREVEIPVAPGDLRAAREAR